MLTVLGLGLILFVFTAYYPLKVVSLLNMIAFMLMDLAYEIQSQEDRGSFEQIRNQVSKIKSNFRGNKKN